MNFTVVGVVVGILTWTPQFLHDQYGTTLAAAAYLSAALGVAQIVGNPLGALSMTRWSKATILIVGLSLTMVVMLAGARRIRHRPHVRRRARRGGADRRGASAEPRHGRRRRPRQRGDGGDHGPHRPAQPLRVDGRAVGVRRPAGRVRHGPGRRRATRRGSRCSPAFALAGALGTVAYVFVRRRTARAASSRPADGSSDRSGRIAHPLECPSSWQVPGEPGETTRGSATT